MTTDAAGATWHADPELLVRYAAGTVDDASAYSVEAHLVACAVCRERVAELVEPARVDAIWTSVVAELDAPRPGVVERVLVRVGVRPDTARILAAAPSLRVSWLLAVAVLTVFAAVAEAQGGHGHRLFLAVAPLLPVAGVALAYGPLVDPAWETSMVAPLSGFRLVLLRAAAVLMTTTALCAVLAPFAGDTGWAMAAWLLPAIGLTVVSLAAGTWVPLHVAAGATALAWGAAVVASYRGSDVALAALPAAQVGSVVAIAVGGAVLLTRRFTFEQQGAS